MTRTKWDGAEKVPPRELPKSPGPNRSSFRGHLQRRLANRFGDLVELERQAYVTELGQYLINGIQERIREGHIDEEYVVQHTAKMLGELREIFRMNNEPWTRELVDALTENLPFDKDVARIFRPADH